MGKNRQSIAIDAEPDRDFAEQVGRDRHLARPTRMRPNWRYVEMPDPNSEPPLDLDREDPRPVDLGWIIIDMRVKVVDHSVHSDAFLTLARLAA